MFGSSHHPWCEDIPIYRLPLVASSISSHPITVAPHPIALPPSPMTDFCMQGADVAKPQFVLPTWRQASLHNREVCLHKQGVCVGGGSRFACRCGGCACCPHAPGPTRPLQHLVVLPKLAKERQPALALGAHVAHRVDAVAVAAVHLATAAAMPHHKRPAFRSQSRGVESEGTCMQPVMML